MRPPAAFVLGLVVAGLLVLAVPLVLVAGDEPASRGGDAASGLPTPPRSALPVPTPAPLAGDETVSHWAPVLRRTVARRAPSAAASPVAVLATETPEGTSNLVTVLRRQGDRTGRLWVQVRLPVLPNDTTGWVPRRALGGLTAVHTHLVVELGRLRATLLRNGRPVFTAPVGVGRPQWPTPRGTFYVRNRLTRYASPVYGPIAFGTSARSDTLTDWPGGGFVGIHGTNRPQDLPGRVSHGCIRLRNQDLLRLDRLMPVGTPVTVRD